MEMIPTLKLILKTRNNSEDESEYDSDDKHCRESVLHLSSRRDLLRRASHLVSYYACLSGIYIRLSSSNIVFLIRPRTMFVVIKEYIVLCS